MLQRPIALIALVSVALASSVGLAAQQPPPTSRWISQDAVAVLEVSQPKVLLDLVLESGLSRTLQASEAYRSQVSKPKFKEFLGVIGYLEGRLGTDWRTGLGRLLGGGVTVAVRPNKAVVMSVDAEDEKLLNELHEIFIEIARSEAAKQGQPDRVTSREYQGVSVWTFGNNEAHAIIGNRLLIANKPETLKAALDLRAGSGGPSLASLPAYQAAKLAAGANPAATMFVNMKVVKQHPQVSKAFEQNENPLFALLFRGITDALRGSNWLAIELSRHGDTLALEAVVDGQAADPSGLTAFAVPSGSAEGALPVLSVPRQIAALSLYRDLHAFYSAKDELFPERTSGLIFFENMMGIFFTGRDLTEEVLGATRPEVRVVVAEQVYDPAVGAPRVQMPAFAAVFHLQDPEHFSRIAEEAWQKAVGLINFTRGQQALPGLIIDRPTRDGVKFTVAYFSPPDEDEKAEVHSRYNYRPALAIVGDYMILSSTDSLAGDLIDSLQAELAGAVKNLPGTHSIVELDAVQLASILRANRESLVAHNMIEDGNTREQAVAQIDLILTVLKSLGRAKLDVGSQNGQSKATLTLDLP